MKAITKANAVQMTNHIFDMVACENGTIEVHGLTFRRGCEAWFVSRGDISLSVIRDEENLYQGIEQVVGIAQFIEQALERLNTALYTNFTVRVLYSKIVFSSPNLEIECESWLYNPWSCLVKGRAYPESFIDIEEMIGYLTK